MDSTIETGGQRRPDWAAIRLEYEGRQFEPAEGSSPGNLMLEALAILFLRRGLKGDIGKA